MWRSASAKKVSVALHVLSGDEYTNHAMKEAPYLSWAFGFASQGIHVRFATVIMHAPTVADSNTNIERKIAVLLVYSC